MLIAGTKGDAGQLLFFDLKKSKQLDSFVMDGGVSSIAITDDTLYMANRNQIVPFDFKSWQCSNVLVGTG